MSKEEGLCIVGRLYIPVVLGRISTSLNSIKSFNTDKNRKMKLYIITLVRYLFDNVLLIYPFRSSFMRLISISLYNTSHLLSLIITLTRFLSPLIYRISIISRRLYDYLKHRISIINYFSCIISSLIRYSYRDYKSIHIKRDIFSRAILENI